MNDCILTLRDMFKSIEDSVNLTDKDFSQALFDYSAYVGELLRMSMTRS